MDILAEAVSITLGPKGRNVVLGKKFGEKYDKEVYELFARTRTHIRIKDLNKAEMLTILFFRIYDPIPILLSKVDLQSDPILSPS